MGATKSSANTTTFRHKHNHTHCIEAALDQAELVCEQAGERFTDLRRQVFELIWAGHTPVKAYDLMSELASKRSGVAPATIYRTLDFLQSQGLVHKLESLNAYMGCSHPEKEHQGHFLICEHCEEVRELDVATFSRSINRIVREQQFLIKRTTIELFGLCASCQKVSAELT
jgi:Fur family zinc uptake transcriptional regulator